MNARPPLKRFAIFRGSRKRMVYGVVWEAVDDARRRHQPYNLPALEEAAECALLWLECVGLEVKLALRR
ncbi:hypothetical protein [Thauera sp.]|uniref:hypothetical protein n=1 Tax=Thauera sp. TaxID=1905334 RepID=UPI002C3B0E3F|nr:hypothetical protein [Thauera sp.]HRP26356.1 hypothetical protein [Thauera sp.]